MDISHGIKRFRQAVVNQASAGSGSFELSIDSADELCREIEDELRGICSSDDRETGRYTWAEGVPAPRDADGEVVPLTPDKLYTSGGMMIRVTYICFIGGLWCALSRDSESLLLLNALHLNRPDSWEKLKKDVSKAGDEDICGYFGFAMSRPCSAECPARDTHDSCAVIAVRDVARRAKALAERDVKEASRG